MLAVLLVAKVVLGAVFVDHGFAARYYANDSLTPPLADSIEFHRDDITCIDEQLAFGNEGEPDLSLHFFNHVDFNFYEPGQPRRSELP